MATGKNALVTLLWTVACLWMASCLPNIRIQVNNENFQSPPYLLEALKQVEAEENRSSIAPQPAILAKATTPPSLDTRVDSSLANPSNKSSEEEYSDDENYPHGSYGVVKEETIEDILDLAPETVPKLAPESVLNPEAMSNYAKIEDSIASDSQADLNSDGKKQPDLLVQKHDSNSRKPQLPVTSSHLKRPILAIQDDETNSKEQKTSSEKESGGAKSLVAPSVLDDEPITKPKRKVSANLPDTLEPSQIMSGITNTSNVPQVVNREYGHSTRTRVTLGGGYVRDRLPPLVNPSSNSYKDDKPEKPVAPLEKSKLQPDSPVGESSLVESVERNKLAPSTSKQTASGIAERPTVVGKPDKRCPKEGVVTFDHPTACDKYFYCEDGQMSEQTCPNGLMYGTRDMIVDFCVHRWLADCGDKIQPNPVSSPGCRWQYGIFSVQGSPKCSPDFYECTAGRYEVKKCSLDGQVYDDRTKTCQYAERVGCTNEALADFQCPADDQANTYWPFPRYFLNERALIHCVNDKPEIVRCTDLERVDPEHLHCVPMAKVWDSPNMESRRPRDKKKVSSA